MYIKQVRAFIDVHVVCYCDGTFHVEELKSIMLLNKNIVTFLSTLGYYSRIQELQRANHS